MKKYEFHLKSREFLSIERKTIKKETRTRKINAILELQKCPSKLPHHLKNNPDYVTIKSEKIYKGSTILKQ